MWEREDKVLVFSGVIDSSGTKTEVEIGTIKEVGEFELLVELSSSWNGPTRVHKDRCMPILRMFSVPNPPPIPEPGDLVLIHDWRYGSKKYKEKKIGTVHSIKFGSSDPEAMVMVSGELAVFDLSKCFILQKKSKKNEEPSLLSYNISVTNKAKEDQDEKVEITKTGPSKRNP